MYCREVGRVRFIEQRKSKRCPGRSTSYPGFRGSSLALASLDRMGFTDSLGAVTEETSLKDINFNRTHL